MTLYLGEKEDRFRCNNINIILYVDFFFQSVREKEKETDGILELKDDSLSVVKTGDPVREIENIK